MNTESPRWNPTAVIEKYDDDQVAYVRDKTGLLQPAGDDLKALCQPYETLEVKGNLLTTAGLNRITQLLIGTSTATLDATRVRLGVGDNAAAAAVGDTALSTGANQLFRVMDATYPTQANGVITFKASFVDAEANFAWACWGIDVGTPTVTSGGTVNAPLINRRVAAMGTKASGTWVLTTTISFS